MRENETRVSVECPVCSCKVEGRDEQDLSECVHVHFCEEHGMERSPGRESKIIAGGHTGYGSEIERGGTRAEPRREAPSTSELQMQEGARKTEAPGSPRSTEGRAPEGMEMRKTTSSGGTGTTTSGEYSLSEAYGVQCPGCEERVTGRSESETSERLREHMSTEHKNEPYMTRLLERLKGER